MKYESVQALALVVNPAQPPGSCLHLDSGTLTPLLKRLEAKGFVARGRSESDERVRVLNLTSEGKQLKTRAKFVPNAIACKITLELDELITLNNLCNKLLDTLTQFTFT